MAICAKENTLITLAIPPFSSGTDPRYEWMGSGTSDTLITKLTEVDGIHLVEREYLQTVIGSGQDDFSAEKVCEMIGADFLILGTVTVLENSLRFNVRVVSSQTTEVVAQTPISIHGPISEILRLQSSLAKELAKTCHLKVPLNKLNYSEGQTESSYHLYNLGKKAFLQGHGDRYSKMGDDYRPVDAEKHLGCLKEAISYFLKAQQVNEGYFVEAHHKEGEARKALIQAEKDLAKRKYLQESYLNKFEADATQAAPAFYNLGIAHQSVGNHLKAIDAFDQFQRWHDSTARPLQWEENLPSHQIVKTEEAPYYFLHGKRELEQGNYGLGRFSYSWRHWVIEADDLIVFSRGYLEKRSLRTGLLQWKYQLTSIQNQRGNRELLQYPNILIVRNKSVFWCSMQRIFVLDLDSGKLLLEIDTRLPDRTQGAFYVFDREDRMMLNYCNESLPKASSGLMAWSIKSGEFKWEQPFSCSPVNAYHQGKWYTTCHETEMWEVDCGTGASRKVETFDEPICQFWPQESHLLIRTSARPRIHHGDLYHRWEFETKTKYREEAKLLFNYFYDARIPEIEKFMVPFMGSGSPHYQLIPASRFYPHTYVSKMDNMDYSSFNVMESIPSYRMSGNQLYGWSTDRTILGYDLASKELAWTKSIASSSSLLDIQGKFVLIKCEGDKLCVYNNLVVPYTKWYLDSWVRKANSQRELHRFKEAMESLNQAYRNANDDNQVNLALGNIHLFLGNMNEALVHYANVKKHSSILAPENAQASVILQNTIGMKQHIPASARVSSIKGHRAYFTSESFTGIAVYDRSLDQLEKGFIKDPPDVWFIQDNALYYKDTHQKFYKKNLDTLQTTKLFEDQRLSLGSNVQDGVTILVGYDFARQGDLLFYMALEQGGKVRKVVARHLVTGDILWEREVDAHVSISTRGPLVFAFFKELVGDKALVCRIDPATGKNLWMKELAFSSYAIKHSIEDRMRLVSEEVGEDLIVTFSYEHHRSFVDYRFEPKWPYYVLDPETGVLRSTYLGQEGINASYDNGESTIISESTWNFPHTYNQNFILKEHWGRPESYRVVEADFHERHPLALSNFPPLSHLSREFDLSKHVEVLNTIIEDKDQRRRFIEAMLPDFKNRSILKGQFSAMGHEPLQNSLRLMIERGPKDDNEEKFIARQLMSLGNNAEPTVMIRAFRKPSGVRFSGVRQVVSSDDGQSIALGHYRGVLMGADLQNNNQYLTSWKRMPQLNTYRSYYHGIDYLEYNEKLLLVDSDSGIYIYDTQELIHYMKNNVLDEKGGFSVDTVAHNISNVVDGNPSSVVSLPGSRRKVIGVDLGVKREIHTMKMLLPEGVEVDLRGSVIMGSTFSETGNFEEIAILENELKVNREVKVVFAQPAVFRYFKIVIPDSRPISISELRFE